MTKRLATFAFALLFLPPIGLALAGLEWNAAAPIPGALLLPALAAMLAVSAFSLLLDSLTFRRTGHSLLRSQRAYLAWSAVAGATLCILLAYLNLFAAAWLTPAASETQALLLAAFCGALLLPAVLIARLWLAGIPGLVKLGTRRFALPQLPAETAALALLTAALGGLLCGPIWPSLLGWLLWLSPLLLLAALQLLWHESTLFSGLAQGDWSRVLLGAIAGIAAGGVALAGYRLSGGAIELDANTWQLTFALAVFGLLCLQLGDVVAEHWRGKPRSEVFKRKPFPIPVVSKKDQ